MVQATDNGLYRQVVYVLHNFFEWGALGIASHKCLYWHLVWTMHV